MRIVHSLKALADENRMNILVMLLNSDLCVGALANRIGLSKPAVSQHLRILRQAGLVRGEKRGYWTHYTVDRQAVAQISVEINSLVQTTGTTETLCRRINDMPPDKHGNKEVNMCQNCCQQPDKLKDKPENCTPEQIRQCHGDAQEHPCSQEECAPEK